MAFNAELEMKALRGRLDGLERKVDTLEKSMRALPDTALMARTASAKSKPTPQPTMMRRPPTPMSPSPP